MPTATAGTFSQTLQEITSIKFAAISENHAIFQEHRAAVTRTLEDPTLSPDDKVTQLLKASRGLRLDDNANGSSKGKGKSDDTFLWAVAAWPLTDRKTLGMIKKSLKLAKHDLNVPLECRQKWIDTLIKGFEREEQKFVYAELFAKLIEEWLAPSMDQCQEEEDVEEEEEEEVEEEEETDGWEEAVEQDAAAGGGGGGGVLEQEKEESVRAVPEVETGEPAVPEAPRKKFDEGKMFAPNDIDPAAIEAYLGKLFEGPEEARALADIRKRISVFCATPLPTANEGDVKDIINGLFIKASVTNEKCETLKEFSRNKLVLKELADVLNVYLSQLSKWEWPQEGVPLQVRRQVDGRYRMYMETLPIQDILLHYIGARWCCIFKQVFDNFFKSPAWQSSSVDQPMSEAEDDRRSWFLKKIHYRYESIHSERVSRQKNDYFMNQLSASDGSASDPSSTPYSEEEEEEEEEARDLNWDVVDQQMGEGDVPKRAGKNLKQNLLHLMLTDSLLHVTLHGKNTVMRSDFVQFGSSLSHTSILTTLKFFGVSESWLSFFRKFLEAPLRTLEAPGVVQTRRRGVPMSYALSDCFGEIMLFCMDFAVNKRTSGQFLYRIHEDFWFWHPNSAVVVQAWKSITEFTDLFGLALNFDKTGSVCIKGDHLDSELPRGAVRWVFLTLESSGHLVIDTASVDRHIAAFRHQLSCCKSVLSWVQAYNKYIGFFMSNFSDPAWCLGTQHLDQIETTLKRIHLALFPEHDGSVVRYLESVIDSRFGVRQISGGWYYWPVRLGGLQLHNPFTKVAVMKGTCHSTESPEERFRQYLEIDKEFYQENLKTFERERSWYSDKPTNKHYHPDDPFMPFEEWCRGRETRDDQWHRYYLRSLGSDLVEWTTPASKELSAAVSALPDATCFMDAAARTKTYSVAGAWSLLTPYWKCTVIVWGDELIERCGGLQLVRDGVLPVGMVGVWRFMKFDWDRSNSGPAGGPYLVSSRGRGRDRLPSPVSFGLYDEPGYKRGPARCT